ncbi:MAG: flagellar basal-body rod protein FlgF [Deltaproteobacteria bacterium]|nr:flagellar basal-body rod protein FlgF [Deltaproteobacteria bacterium]
MKDVMYTVASGAIASQLRLEIISNNLANMNTSGFKKDDAVFRSYMPRSYDNAENLSGKTSYPGNNLPVYFPGNYHVAISQVRSDFSTGPMKETGNPLDVALDGAGFFCIRTPSGIRYSRKGDFSVNSEGVLVTGDGFPVMGNGGEIRINGTKIAISGDGRISVDEEPAGALKIVDFPRPYPLAKVGNNLFKEVGNGAAPKRADKVKVRQGVIELSNVEPVKMITDMISVLRSYESYQKIMQIDDSLTLKTVNEVGGVG